MVTFFLALQRHPRTRLVGVVVEQTLEYLLVRKRIVNGVVVHLPKMNRHNAGNHAKVITMSIEERRDLNRHPMKSSLRRKRGRSRQLLKIPRRKQ